MAENETASVSRRDFLQGAGAGMAIMAVPGIARATASAATAFDPADKAAVLARDRRHASRERQAAAGLDRAALHRRREPQLPAGRGVHGGARRRRPASPASSSIPTSGKPGVFGTLDAGAKTTLGDLLHVRRQAVRSRRSGARRRSRRGWSRRTGWARSAWAAARSTRRARRILPERADGLQGGGQEAAGQPGAGVRGRGGDRLAALRRDREQPRGAGRS